MEKRNVTDTLDISKLAPGAKLRIRRQLLGKTLADVGNAINAWPATVGLIERGERCRGAADLVAQIDSVLAAWEAEHVGVAA